MYIIYVFTHVYFFIQDRIIILVLSRWSIKWQIESMNFEINIMFFFKTYNCIHQWCQVRIQKHHVIIVLEKPFKSCPV
jgi:hypothetical protein